MQENQPASKSRTESSHLPVRRLPALRRSSHEITLALHHGQLLYRACMCSRTLTRTHRLMTVKINDFVLSADRFCLYFSKRIHSVLAITFNRPGKGVWYFHTGGGGWGDGLTLQEEKGSNVALYLAQGSNRKSN